MAYYRKKRVDRLRVDDEPGGQNYSSWVKFRLFLWIAFMMVFLFLFSHGIF